MRTRLKRTFVITLAAALLCSVLPFSSFALAAPLKEGSRGQGVLDLKARLYDLGYLQSLKNVSNRYTADTAEKVESFQLQNSLPPTGEADLETLEAIFSAQAVKAPLPENRPLYNILPDVLPQTDFPGMPALDGAGFLAEPGIPYTYKNRDAGIWRYISDSLRIDIVRYYQSEGEIEWFEVYVSYGEEGKPVTVESRKDGSAFQSPLTLAEQAQAVCAITDDFYRYRVKYKQRTGIVVRDGEIKADRTYAQDRSRIPSLEVLAMFGDGTLKTFASDAHTAQEYIDMGVTDTWAFGSALVQEGEVPRYFYSKDYRSYREPRCAFGMMEPGRYCALVITGRKTGSRGAYFGWMAEKMQAMGAKEALNLDGGGTVALIFQGEMINHSERNQSSRQVSGLIAFIEPANP